MSRRLGLLTVAVLATAATVHGAEPSGYLTASTDYVYRGISRSDAQPALSGGFDVDGDRWFFGAWVSTLTFDDSQGFGDNLEWVPYLGVSWLDRGAWRVDTLIASHVLDGSSDRIAGSFTEYSVVTSFRDTWAVELTHIPNALGTRSSATYAEAEWSARLGRRWDASVNGGFAQTSRAIGENYLFGDAGVTRRWSAGSVDARVHWTDARARDALGELADLRFVLSVTLVR